jgi:hypothetical protein
MSEPINDGGPVFPNSHDARACYGMSLRDYFAGQALAGMGAQIRKTWGPLEVPHECYAMADLMLEKRKAGEAK